jgi:hypothetical protein
MSIKKAYQSIVEFLKANKDSKVSTVLDQVIELASAKSGGRSTDNILRDAEGEVLAVFCYYHKRYEPVADCDYGVKKTSASGLNSMCKEGTSAWTKQQRVAKTANANLLDQVQEGVIETSDIGTLRDSINEARGVIVPREDGIGFETLEAAKEALL